MRLLLNQNFKEMQLRRDLGLGLTQPGSVLLLKSGPQQARALDNKPSEFLDVQRPLFEQGRSQPHASHPQLKFAETYEDTAGPSEMPCNKIEKHNAQEWTLRSGASAMLSQIMLMMAE